MSVAQSYVTPQRMRTELIQQGWATDDSAPSSRAILHMIVEGRLDAEQVNGRYRIPRSHLPQIAALFGLKDRASK